MGLNNKENEKAEFIIWTEKYSVENTVLDNQHKYLIKIINNLYNGTHGDEGQYNVKTIIDELWRYTDVHLKTEEKMLQNINYHQLDSHIQLHGEMVEKIKSWNLTSDCNEKEELTALLDFLKKWWTNHILIEDHKYVEFMQS
ncbi:hemerythrin [Desulfuromusa kysingii]|uniref:Hemerythrin n=1 Tax=Desulfuromusa kysingii TaxID=37625 RepID=A0A1H3W1P0_9BACT|nr:bacteriohemerythrin [Desulfuromusa kysingii]SDZ80949.1 hemerythrin [Desulfuromusa kysingii]